MDQKALYNNREGTFFRKMMVITFLLFAVPVTNAQNPDTTVTATQSLSKHPVINNSFWDNWFASFGAGVQSYFGDHDLQMKIGDRFTPAFDLSVGKWFTPAVGARVAFNGFTFKGVSGWSGHSMAHPNVGIGNYMGFIRNAVVDVNGKVISGDIYGKERSGTYDLYKTQINYLQTRADVLFNISNISGGYEKGRVYSFIPYVGIGWMTTFNYDIKNKRSNELSASVGLLNNFRLSDAIDFHLDVRGSYLNDRFDGQIGGLKGEGPLSATVGITYKFKKRDWDRNGNSTVPYTGGNNYYREKIKELEKENLGLLDQLSTNTQGQAIIDRKLVAVPQLTVFPIDTWIINEDARTNLGFLAKIMKETNAISPAKYMITGYADNATGSTSRNQTLSSERARVVKECLVNEFGVPSHILSTRHQGGANNMFYGDPRLSRCAIITAD